MTQLQTRAKAKVVVSKRAEVGLNIRLVRLDALLPTETSIATREVDGTTSASHRLDTGVACHFAQISTDLYRAGGAACYALICNAASYKNGFSLGTCLLLHWWCIGAKGYEVVKFHLYH